MTKPIDIDDLVHQSHGLAVTKGWWDEALVHADRTGVPVITPERACAKLMLIVTEVAEACECVRDGDMYTTHTESGKPLGFAIELADIVIRVADLAGAYGIDLDEAIRVKHAYNETRPERHGGKAL